MKKYLAAEAFAGDLDGFCVATRKYVVKATDYPECPPHTELALVDFSKTRVSCVAGSHCVVNYWWLGRFGPNQDLSPFKVESPHNVKQRIAAPSCRTSGA